MEKKAFYTKLAEKYFETFHGYPVLYKMHDIGARLVGYVKGSPYLILGFENDSGCIRSFTPKESIVLKCNEYPNSELDMIKSFRFAKIKYVTPNFEYQIYYQDPSANIGAFKSWVLNEYNEMAKGIETIYIHPKWQDKIVNLKIDNLEWLDVTFDSYPQQPLFGCVFDAPAVSDKRQILRAYPYFIAYHTFTDKRKFIPKMAEIVNYMPKKLIGKVNAVAVFYKKSDLSDRHVSKVFPFWIGSSVYESKT